MERHRQDTGFQQFQQAEPGIDFFITSQRSWWSNLTQILQPRTMEKNQGVSQLSTLLPVPSYTPKGSKRNSMNFRDVRLGELCHAVSTMATFETLCYIFSHWNDVLKTRRKQWFGKSRPRMVQIHIWVDMVWVGMVWKHVLLGVDIWHCQFVWEQKTRLAVYSIKVWAPFHG